MKDLKKDLAELKKLSGDAFHQKAVQMKTLYTDAEEIAEIHRFIKQSFDDIGEEIEVMKEEVRFREQIEEIAPFINLSYIARHYFNKSKQWLSNRINGSIVNGKPCKFTPQDVEIFNHALQDMSKKIGSLIVS